MYIYIICMGFCSFLSFICILLIRVGIWWWSKILLLYKWSNNVSFEREKTKCSNIFFFLSLFKKNIFMYIYIYFTWFYLLLFSLRCLFLFFFKFLIRFNSRDFLRINIVKSACFFNQIQWLCDDEFRVRFLFLLLLFCFVYFIYLI